MSKSKVAAEHKDVPTEQVRDMCFNIYGFAYEHRIEDREINQRITARPFSPQNYKTRLATLTSQGKTVTIPLMEMTERERAEADPPNTLEYIIVGLLPADLEDQEIGKLAKGKGIKGKAVGLEWPDEYLTKMGEEALRVVAEVTDEAPAGGTKLFALIDPTDGVCYPYAVNQTEVFYFHEFRDDTTSSEARKGAWNELVKAQTIRSQAGKVAAGKQRRLKQAKDTSKIICEPEQNIKNELVMYSSAMMLQPDAWLAGALKEALRVADKDLDEKPFTRESALEALLSREWEFGPDEAGALVEEVRQLWPEIMLSTELVMKLRTGIVETGIAIEYRLLRGFLAYASKTAERGSLVTPEKLVRTSWYIADTVLGPAPAVSRASISQDQTRALLGALKNKLQEISRTASDFSAQLKASVGDQVLIPDSLADIFATYGDARDIDTAKLMFNLAIRYVLTMLSSKTEVVKEPIDKLIELLDRLTTTGSDK